MFRVWLCLLTILTGGLSLQADELAPTPREVETSAPETVAIEITTVRVPKHFVVDLGIEERVCALTARELKMVLTAIKKSSASMTMSHLKAHALTAQKAVIQSGDNGFEVTAIPAQGLETLYLELLAEFKDLQNPGKSSIRSSIQMSVGHSLMVQTQSFVQTQTTENKLPGIGYPRWRTKQEISLEDYVIVTPKLNPKE
ncbi:MAG: hypothetical protein ACRC8S_10710 [Fimbriiglobus sp.]